MSVPGLQLQQLSSLRLFKASARCVALLIGGQRDTGNCHQNADVQMAEQAGEDGRVRGSYGLSGVVHKTRVVLRRRCEVS